MLAILKIMRGVPGNQYWEEFEIEVKPFLTVTAALVEIQKNPVNRKGEKVTPVAWEQGCLEEVCGSCSILINGRPRQACSALIQQMLQQSHSSVVTLAPMTKFPLVRDLVIDRDVMFQNLKTVKAWVEVDDALDRGFGPKISQELQETLYSLSTCMTCGCCTEACPQINQHSKFIGPAAISQARQFNAHPVGNMQKADRNRALMQEGGITECGNAQNCVQVCPKLIPLTESIAVMGRSVVQQAFRDLVKTPDVS